MLGNVASFVPTLEGTGKTAKFGRIDIRERVIDMGGRSVAIANITTLSLLTTSRSLSRLLFRITGAALIGYFLVTTQTRYGSVDPAPVLLGLAAIIASFFVRDLSHLVIVTNDGGRTMFESKDIKGLAEIKRFLADKINRGDVTAGPSFTVNQGKVENKYYAGDDRSTNIDNSGSGPIVTGNNNQVAANSPGAKVGPVETTFSATNSPGAVVGTGNTVRGNTVQVQHIDYSTVLPTIEEWQRFYAQREDSRQLAERLSELEVLMRSGTPSPESKGRVRSLAGELSHLLQGYPPAVQLFEAVTRLVGM